MENTNPLALLRENLRGSTQAQLARTIGVSPQLLNDVLKGVREPRGKILDYLGLEVQIDYRRKRRSK